MKTLCLLLLFIAVLSSKGTGQTQLLDLTFNPNDKGFGYGDGLSTTNEYLGQIVEQPDGKVIIAGGFTSFNNIAAGSILRLDVDGDIDQSFVTGSGFSLDETGQQHHSAGVGSLALTTGGKIIAGGWFNIYNGVSVPPLVQLYPNGTLDNAFVSRINQVITPDKYVSELHLDNENRILVAMASLSLPSNTRIIRLYPSGELDTTFQEIILDEVGLNKNEIHVLYIQNDGKILIGGSATHILGSDKHRLARINEDGTLDTTFRPVLPGPGIFFSFEPSVYAIVEQDDGRIIIGVGGFGQHLIQRLNSDGSHDTTFQTGVGFDPLFTLVTDIEELTDGRLVVVGQFRSYNAVSRNKIVVIHPDGTLDANADPGAGFSPQSAFVADVAELRNGKLILSGNFCCYQNYRVNMGLIRLRHDLSWDHTFINETGANCRVKLITPLDNGNILIGGTFSKYNGELRHRLARLLPDGAVDPSFVPPDLQARTISALATQSNNRVLIAYENMITSAQTIRNLIRTLPNGQPDGSFNTGSGFNQRVTSIVVQNDDKIIVAGEFTKFNDTTAMRIVRLHPDGAIDHTFNAGYGANMTIENMLSTGNNRILIVGRFTLYDSVQAHRIALLNPDGSHDASFSPDVNGTIVNLCKDPDGKIIIGGTFTQIGGFAINHIARLNLNGTPDTTFQSGAGFHPPTHVRLAVQLDGRIVAGGRFETYDGFPANRLARINRDGSFDTTFMIGTGANRWVRAIAVQNDGKILAGGDFTEINGIGRNRIARLFDRSPEGIRPIVTEKQKIRVYPIPAGNTISIEAPAIKGNATIRFYDMQGRIVKQLKQNIHEIPLVPTCMLLPGIYILEVSDGTRLLRTRILKN